MYFPKEKWKPELPGIGSHENRTLPCRTLFFCGWLTRLMLLICAKLQVREACLQDGREAPQHGLPSTGMCTSRWEADTSFSSSWTCMHRDSVHACALFSSYWDPRFCQDNTHHQIRHHPPEPTVLMRALDLEADEDGMIYNKACVLMFSWIFFSDTTVAVLSAQKIWLIKYFRK